MVKQFFCFFLAAAGAAAAPLRVETLSPILTEIAAEVGGPEATVTGILQPGTDPHTFEPAPSDLRALAQADLVLASGLGMEAYLDKIALNSGTQARLLEAGQMLGQPVVTTGSDGRAEPDPHWWHSIPAMVAVTRQIAHEFALLRPGGAAGFRARAEAYVTRLNALEAWARTELATLPSARRRLVTTHNAFGWFARDYGFTVHSISGVNDEAEPDARDFARLIELIRRDRIPAIFPESSENSKLAAAIARETGARLGAPLYADGLVPEPDGSTYEAMYRHNLHAIIAGLR